MGEARESKGGHWVGAAVPGGLALLGAALLLGVPLLGRGAPNATPVLAAATGPWFTRADLPTARLGLAATTAKDGTIYTIGGWNVDNLTTVERFDPVANKWTTAPSLPEVKRDLGAVTTADGTIYAIAGIGPGNGSTSSMAIFDPTANSWSMGTPVPTGAGGEGPGVALGSDGRIYVAGGFSAGYLSGLQVYDPGAGTWTTGASMSAGRAGIGLVTGGNGKLYAMGGQDSSGAILTNEEYDPKLNMWTKRQALPTGHSWTTVVAGSDRRIYVIGGGPIQVYDPFTDTWSGMQDMPTGRQRLGLALGHDGGIYAIGGATGGDNLLTANEEMVLTRIALPFVVAPVPVPTTIIANGGFENGLTGWQASQPPALPVSVVTDPALAHSGSGAALLGSPSYNSNCSNGGIPTGPAYVAQQVTVPNTPKPTLTFWYHIFTQDWTGPDPNHPIYDSFGVYVNTIDDAHGLFHDGNPSESNAPGCTKPILDLGWKEGSVDLSAHRGQTVTLYFANVNGSNPIWNTYTYLDDVAIATQ